MGSSIDTSIHSLNTIWNYVGFFLIRPVSLHPASRTLLNTLKYVELNHKLHEDGVAQQLQLPCYASKAPFSRMTRLDR